MYDHAVNVTLIQIRRHRSGEFPMNAQVDRNRNMVRSDGSEPVSSGEIDDLPLGRNGVIIKNHLPSEVFEEIHYSATKSVNSLNV